MSSKNKQKEIQGNTKLDNGTVIIKPVQEKKYTKSQLITFLQQYRFDLSTGEAPLLGDNTEEWFDNKYSE